MKMLEELDSLGGVLQDDKMRRAAEAALYDDSRRLGETLRQSEPRREQQFDQAAQHEVRLPSVARGLMLEGGAGQSYRGLQNFRTFTLGSFDARQFAGIVGDGMTEATESGRDSEEEVFAEIERLDRSEEDASVLFGAQSKTRPIIRDQKGELCKGRQLSDRLELPDESTDGGHLLRKSKIPIARVKAISRCADCVERGCWYRECP